MVKGYLSTETANISKNRGKHFIKIDSELLQLSLFITRPMCSKPIEELLDYR